MNKSDLYRTSLFERLSWLSSSLYALLPLRQHSHTPTPLFSFLTLLILLFALPTPVLAQPVNPEIRIAVREDTRAVYVFHTAMLPIGHGFNIYRRDPDEDEFKALNASPVRGVASGAELRALLGTLYDDIEQTTQQTTANGTLTKLHSDLRTANLLTFIYPQIAEALGRLFIDTTAPTGSPATYRIEFVDALDEPTGETLQLTALLLPQKPGAPTQLRAQNQGDKITLFWRFIPPSENVDDKVIRFEAYRIDPTTNQHQRVHDNVILRNNALFEYALNFEAPTTGHTEQLYVRSIDISGQASEPSTLLRYTALDVDPPRTTIDVSARRLNSQRIQVSWSASDASEVAGFNLYRSTELMSEAAYVQLNRDLLSLNETVFNDTLPGTEASLVYYYRVTAVDGNGNEGPLSTAAMALFEDREPPAAPSDVIAAEDESRQIRLTWSMHETPSDFDTFIILRRPLGAGAPDIPVRINPGKLVESEFVDQGIGGAGFLDGATYRYSILSADRAGNFSEASSVDVRLADASAPGAPNGVQAVVDNASRIAVFWNPSTATDVLRYTVYRRETGATRLDAFPVHRQDNRFEDTSVVPGTSYEYWVTAADSAGNESIRSEPFTLRMQDFDAPRHVRNLRVSVSPTFDVSLNWEPVSAADLAGYRVYRADSQTGVYQPVTDELILDMSWIDPDGAPGQWYRVHAVDTSGNESRPGETVYARPPVEQ